MLPAMPSALAAASGRELAEARGRGRGAEDPADRRRVEAALVEGAGRRHADASRRSRCPRSTAARSSRPLAPRRLGEQRAAAGDDHGRHVRDRLGVRVVEVEPVAEHRVRERRVRCRQSGLQPDHRGLRLAAELGHRRATLGGDPQAVCGEAAADRVEHVQLRRLDDRRPGRRRGRARAPTLRTAAAAFIPSTPRSVPGKLRTASGAVRL